MIQLKNFDTNNFNELIKDYFLVARNYKLIPFGISKYPNVLCQGYGTNFGKRMVICDIKDPGLSEFYIVNEAVNFSQTIFNERPTVEKFYIIFRQELTENVKGEFKNRLPPKLKRISTVIDLNDLQRYFQIIQV